MWLGLVLWLGLFKVIFFADGKISKYVSDWPVSILAERGFAKLNSWPLVDIYSDWMKSVQNGLTFNPTVLKDILMFELTCMTARGSDQWHCGIVGRLHMYADSYIRFLWTWWVHFKSLLASTRKFSAWNTCWEWLNALHIDDVQCSASCWLLIISSITNFIQPRKSSADLRNRLMRGSGCGRREVFVLR